ncbi:MAG TPA: hypothetical protein VG734_14075 [Lacunisphaera sp.]|nr:hypothetical protein [Lacunisphaera sp.]
MTDSPRRPFSAVWWIVPVGLLALLPWLRNHAWIRDFYDYGLVISGLGLLEHGQRPYVDFATPIQAGFFGLSWLVEKAGGTTYLALARGAAGLIILMGGGFVALLARRWPGWAAAVVALAVTLASASQHTILWHNSLGVGCLALVAWTTAVAPAWRRLDWPWHAATAAGLFLGGLNKLNFHLVALVVALGWALRAGLHRRATWPAVGATMVGWLVVGAAFPVAAELAWTGATGGMWWHNVVGLAAGTRASGLGGIWSWKFLFVPIHDYYPGLWLPQVGLAGVGLSLCALAGCWPARGNGENSQWDRVLLPLATLLAAAAGAALLATNQDIAYLGLGAWLALVAALWLGFAPAPRRAWFLGGLVLPALALAVIAGVSAWQGQRSQFGHSLAPRSAYRFATDAGPAFAYFAGVRVPPEAVDTMVLMQKWLPAPGADGARAVFYGPGTEWLNRFLPGQRLPGQPLWVHWGTTYGPQEAQHLLHAFATDEHFQAVLTTLARDDWPPEIRYLLGQYYERDLLGPVTLRWTRRTNASFRPEDSLAFVNAIGGNVAGPALHTDQHPVALLPYAGERRVLGVRGGDGWLLLTAPCYRFAAAAVMERSPHAGPGPLQADFKVITHGSIPEDVRWSARVELPAGQRQIEVPFKVDALGRPLQLRVSVPDSELALVTAGYRNLEISHAIESLDGAPRLRDGSPPDDPPAAELAASALGTTGWHPQQLTVRHGRAGEQGLELAPGGELWIHSDNAVAEITGQLVCSETAGARPTARVVWYKGGRLQVLQQGGLQGNQPWGFRAWWAEPGGWYGILLDAGAGVAPAQLRLTNAKPVP